MFRKGSVMKPEPWIGELIHSGLQRPASKCSSDRLTAESKRPARTSCSILRSHWSARNSSNHSEKRESSSGERRETTASSSSTLTGFIIRSGGSGGKRKRRPNQSPRGAGEGTVQSKIQNGVELRSRPKKPLPWKINLGCYCLSRSHSAPPPHTYKEGIPLPSLFLLPLSQFLWFTHKPSPL